MTPSALKAVEDYLYTLPTNIKVGMQLNFYAGSVNPDELYIPRDLVLNIVYEIMRVAKKAEE